MIFQWKTLALPLCLLAMIGCSGKIAQWFEQPTSFHQKVQEMREERITSEPIVSSNAEQRLKWREERSKEFHKWRQLHNPKYKDYSYLCLTGDTLELYMKQQKEIKRERVNRPNKRRSR